MYQRDSSGNGGEVIMEVQQQKKRSGVKFNVIDFLIIVIALLCILSLVARYTNVLEKIGVSEQMQQYEVTLPSRICDTQHLISFTSTIRYICRTASRHIWELC